MSETLTGNKLRVFECCFSMLTEFFGRDAIKAAIEEQEREERQRQPKDLVLRRNDLPESSRTKRVHEVRHDDFDEETTERIRMARKAVFVDGPLVVVLSHETSTDRADRLRVAQIERVNFIETA